MYLLCGVGCAAVCLQPTTRTRRGAAHLHRNMDDRPDLYTGSNRRGLRVSPPTWRPNPSVRAADRLAQLGEPAADRAAGRGRVFDGVGKHLQDDVVSTEVGEVFERQVDGADEGAGAAQLQKFVALSLPA